jgi:alkylation response protein AidB-like acyl-CoA dehydrogenase
MKYSVDLRDIRFQLFEWLDLQQVLSAKRYSDWDVENLDLVIGEALKIAEEELAPGNDIGDREGASWTDGIVKVPVEYQSAYKTIAEGGWIGSVNSGQFGGLDLPHSVGTVINEFFTGANMSLALVLLLTRGAGELIEHHGTEQMRRLFCENLYSGKWTGTMCLTEPQAGSDVGASTTRAEPRDDGSYLISGEKIFITFGDHDMTENVVHAVLARIPGSPAGSKGLSLFVVPKFRVESDGSLGDPNDVTCASIEHKMGIHGSPTCTMLFGQAGGCQGFLLGEVDSGLKLMFEMMNAARIEVGLQGLAVAAASHQAALGFAKERLQGRHWDRGSDRGTGPVPIIEHPDVRRMLASSAAYVEGIRALLLQTAFYIDRSYTTEGDEQHRYRSLVELLTPVCKAWGSDWGFRVTEWCLQVYGGYGYTKDYPAEQYLRDAKIASIYEGTNGIQALDLVTRKLRLDNGQPFMDLLSRARKAASSVVSIGALEAPAGHLESAVDVIGGVLQSMPKHSDATLLTLMNAVPFLDMFGHVLAGCFLFEQAAIANQKLVAIAEKKGVPLDPGAEYRQLLDSDRDARFYHNKIQTAAYFGYRGLPNVAALGVALRAGEISCETMVL